MSVASLRSLLFCLLLLPAVPGILCGSVLTVPPDLKPGDQYRIVFVTLGVRDATSANISDYDTFVNDAANAPGSILASLGVMWKVIGSTASESAFSHIGSPFSIPIYRSDGTRVADDSADFWDGTLLDPINLDEMGNAEGLDVWTGSTAAGLPKSPFGGGVLVLHGLSNSIDGTWLDAMLAPGNEMLHFYGISDVLAVPVPEPGTMTLIGVGGMVMLLKLRRRGRLQANPVSRKPAL